MSALQDVVWRIQADVSTAVKAMEGKTIAPVPRPFSAPSRLSPREMGPRTFPNNILVLDEDYFHSKTRERAKDFEPSISIEAQGALEVEQGLPDVFPDQDPPTSQTVLTIDASSMDCTFSDVTAGELVGIQIGGAGASYKIGPDDDADAVAAGLAAAAVTAGLSVTASGATASASGPVPKWTQGVSYMAYSSTVYHAHKIRARIRVDDKALRKIVGDLVEGVYPFNPDTTSIALADGTILQIYDVEVSDSAEFAGESETEIFIHDVTWSALYSAVVLEQYTSVVAVNAQLDGSYATPDWWGPVPANQL